MDNCQPRWRNSRSPRPRWLHPELRRGELAVTVRVARAAGRTARRVADHT